VLVPSDSLRTSLELATARYEQSLEQAWRYLEDRRISLQVARDFRLGVVSNPLKEHEGYTGRLAIPYLTPTGVATIRFRCLLDHDCKQAGCPKYLGLANHDPRLFNVGVLLSDSDVLVVCEGEFDAITVAAAGVAAIGYPGVENWKPFFKRAIGEHFGTILVVADLDDKGKGLDTAKWIARELGGRVVKPPMGYDLNSLAQERGLDYVRGMFV
jgi:hypothetical protein